MLDEEEFAKIERLYRHCAKTKEDRERRNPSPDTIDLGARFDPVRLAYQDITGFAETNPNAIMHHRLALYGGPCSNCGKPLRTPQARFCAACGASRSGD